MDLAVTLEDLFAKDMISGLLGLGIRPFTDPLPASFVYWQHFSRLFVTTMCRLPKDGLSSLDFLATLEPPSDKTLLIFLDQKPAVSMVT